MTGKWWRAGALVVLAAWAAVLAPAAAEAAPGTIAGAVTPVQWAQEVEVCVVEAQPSETCTVPAANGSYLMEVPLGEYQIEFIPSFRSRLLIQYYNHQRALVNATTIKLFSGASTATGINGDLIEGAVIEGAVTAAGTGLPLSEVEVCAVSSGSAAVRRCEETDASGAYELHSLPGGTYRVSFRGSGKSGSYAPMYYDGKQSLGEATPVTVVPGVTESGVDAALEEGAEIEGSVSAAGAGPQAGIAVCLFEAAAATADRCTYSDELGNYRFEGLASGSYQVGFSLEPAELGGTSEGESDGYESQYFDGVATRAQATAISILAPSAVAGVNAMLSHPPVPAAVVPPPAVDNPIVAAPPVIPQPKPKPKRCKRGFRKKKVKGKVRCVKVVHRHRRHKHPNHNRKGKQ
jgi:hypothetical protein